VIAELKLDNGSESDPKKEDIQARLETQFEADRGEARAALERRDYQEEDLRNADLREAFLVGLDLRWARLEGAVLTRARLEGAVLRGARLEGAVLWGVKMTDVVVQYASVIGASLSQVRNLTQEQLNQMYGDSETDLPETDLTPPTHWPSTPIPEDQYDACLRKWMIGRGAPEFLLPATTTECTAHADSP